jgi:UDP-N-acetylglucosamine 2-epimerase (non-hydrolysing)
VKKKLVVVLGIRPDVIRASLILNKIRQEQDFETIFIWSGQHYSANLKDIFFQQLGVKPPEIELNVEGSTDAELTASVIQKLYKVLSDIRPVATVFLGDTNTVMGAIASAQLNIPIVHIEGCMRSYDWRMPEEKYRTTVDHLSDVIYTYFDEYKQNGISEGLNPKSIVVTQNLIVDVLQEAYFKKEQFYKDMATDSFFKERELAKSSYFLMTCHRRENVSDRDIFQHILDLAKYTKKKIYFPAGYRSQQYIKEFALKIPSNIKIVDPIGYQEFLTLMVNSCGVLTDSGTVVEETCVLQIPTIQIRKSTERPQVYDTGGCVKLDPELKDPQNLISAMEKLETLQGKKWQHHLGDGLASQRIVDDLIQRVRENNFGNHRPENYHLNIRRSYQSDCL